MTACGLAQGADLPATVMPFILRGIRLAEAVRAGADLLAGTVRGRLVVDVNA